MSTFFSIQRIAAATGLSVHTLRYYERIGLIDPIPRLNNTHRQYRAEDLRWIEFLLRLRSTGLSIREMLRYAELRRQGHRLDSVSERKALLSRHALTLQAELVNLKETLSVLHDKVALYTAMEAELRAGAEQQPATGAAHERSKLRKGIKKVSGS